MSEPIRGLWAVYLAEYPDEGSALIEAGDATEAIRIARHTDPEAWGWPWGDEPAEALTVEAMTTEAMVVRVADGEADPADTVEGQWLANVACAQAMEIERLRAQLATERDEALELAARVADEHANDWLAVRNGWGHGKASAARDIAENLRALKSDATDAGKEGAAR